MLSAYSQGSVVAFAEVDVVKDSGINQKQITDAINNNAGEFTSIGGPNFSLDNDNTEVLTEIDNAGVNVHVYRNLFTLSKAKVQSVFTAHQLFAKWCVCVCVYRGGDPVWPLPMMPPPRPWSPASDIWWPSLDICSSLFTSRTPPPNWCWHLVAVEADTLSTPGRYASYWNAFLLVNVLVSSKVFIRTDQHWNREWLNRYICAVSIQVYCDQIGTVLSLSLHRCEYRISYTKVSSFHQYHSQSKLPHLAKGPRVTFAQEHGGLIVFPSKALTPCNNNN